MDFIFGTDRMQKTLYNQSSIKHLVQELSYILS